MTTIGTRVISFDNDQLESAEDLACAQLHMEREAIMERMGPFYEKTLSACLETFDCRAIYASFAIEKIEEGKVLLEGGACLESELLPTVLAGACELVLYGVTVHGYEELLQRPDTDDFDKMFYDAWGVGFSMSAHRHVKDLIAEHASEEGLYIGRGWTPGEDSLEMKLQTKLFELLDPSPIGLELTGTFLMKPMMSVTGFIGVSSDPAIQNAGSELGESH